MLIVDVISITVSAKAKEKPCVKRQTFCYFENDRKTEDQQGLHFYQA
jgi:hypothetical protein